MDKIRVKTAETIKLKILEATPGMIYGRLLRNPRHFFGVLFYIVKRENLRIPGLDLAALFCTGV